MARSPIVLPFRSAMWRMPSLMSELFPTQVRSTAVAFCNGSGRVITSFGPLAAGLLVVQLGGLTNATGIMTGFAVLSIVAVVLGRETRDEQLPR